MVIHQLDLFGNAIAIPIVKEESAKPQATTKNEIQKEDTEPKSLPLFEEAEMPSLNAAVPSLEEEKTAETETKIEPTEEGDVVYSDNKILVKLKRGRPKKTQDEIEAAKITKAEKGLNKRGRASISEVDSTSGLLNVPDDETLNQKLYYKISVVADWFGVNNSMIRYWENEFDILKPRLTRKGDRLFRVEDIKNLQLIYQLLKVRKFSIEGAKEYLKQNKQNADVHRELTESLSKIKIFLIDLKTNLGV